MKLGRYLKNLWLTASLFSCLLPNYSCSSLRNIETVSKDYASEELGVPESSILWLDGGYASTEAAYRIVKRVVKGRENTYTDYWNGHDPNIERFGYQPPIEGNETMEALIDADSMVKRDKVVTYEEAYRLLREERNLKNK